MIIPAKEAGDFFQRHQLHHMRCPAFPALSLPGFCRPWNVTLLCVLIVVVLCARNPLQRGQSELPKNCNIPARPEGFPAVRIERFELPNPKINRVYRITRQSDRQRPLKILSARARQIHPAHQNGQRRGFSVPSRQRQIHSRRNHWKQEVMRMAGGRRNGDFSVFRAFRSMESPPRSTS